MLIYNDTLSPHVKEKGSEMKGLDPENNGRRK